MSEAGRLRYTHRLVGRVLEEVASGGRLDRDHMQQADAALTDALLAYERGDIDKDELDSKAVGYLHHFRATPGM